jgi:hypothetical protein
MSALDGGFAKRSPSIIPLSPYPLISFFSNACELVLIVAGALQQRRKSSRDAKILTDCSAENSLSCLLCTAIPQNLFMPRKFFFRADPRAFAGSALYDKRLGQKNG